MGNKTSDALAAAQANDPLFKDLNCYGTSLAWSFTSVDGSTAGHEHHQHVLAHMVDYTGLPTDVVTIIDQYQRTPMTTLVVVGDRYKRLPDHAQLAGTVAFDADTEYNIMWVLPLPADPTTTTTATNANDTPTTATDATEKKHDDDVDDAAARYQWHFVTPRTCCDSFLYHYII